MGVLDEFRSEHARIDAELSGAEAVASDGAALLARLKTMRPVVLAHFRAKETFYVTLAEQCTKASDAAAAQLTRIFESNMKMQSAAVVRFFESLENASAPNVAATFRTLSGLMRQRFGTEEKAVFPLFKRTSDKLQEQTK